MQDWSKVSADSEAQSKTKKQRTPHYKDIRVFDDDLDGADEQEIQRQFTEILTMKENKYSQSENQKEEMDGKLEFEDGNETYIERFTRRWKEKYASKLNFRFTKRQFPLESPVDDHNYSTKAGELPYEDSEVRSHKNADIPIRGLFFEPDEVRGSRYSRSERTPRKTYSETEMNPKRFSKRHKRVSSAEAHLIEPIRLRIEGIRFFRRRKQSEDVQKEQDDATCEPHLKCFKTSSETFKKDVSESIDVEKCVEEGVQILAKPVEGEQEKVEFHYEEENKLRRNCGSLESIDL